MALITDAYQIGASSDPNKNFTLRQPAVPDGSLILSRGNASAPGSTILTVNPQGAIVLPDGTYVGGNGYRNRIINGNFDFWQRGTSGTLNNGTSNAYGIASADRWWAQAYAGNSSSGTAAIQISQQAFTLGQAVVPGEPKYFMRVQPTLLPALGTASAAIRVMQKIEFVRTLAGKQVTVSFWAKADSAKTYCLFFNQVFGTGGSPSAPVATAGVTFNVTTSWQYFAFTQQLSSIAGKTLGSNNDDSLNVEFVLYKQDGALYGDSLGTIGSYSTSAYLDLARVQVEAGAVATAFEDRDYGEELRRCQRYWWPCRQTTGIVSSTTAAWRVVAKNPVTMRVSPSLSLSGSMGGQAGTAGATLTGLATSYSTPESIEFDATISTSSATAGAVFSTSVGNSNYIGVSAEL